MGSNLGEYLKSLVYGGMDGIITTFAIVCAASGANKDDATIVTMGVANLIADAISMGMGDYISDKAEQDYAQLELSKTKDQLAKGSSSQKKELVEHYVKERGMARSDAEEVVSRIAKYDEVFAEQLMQELSGVDPPDESNSFLKGMVTAGSFILFGTVPLLIFLLKPRIAAGLYPQSPLRVATLATALTMFLLGALSGTFTNKNVLKAGCIMAGHGLLAAYAAYAIGYFMEDTGHQLAAAALGKSSGSSNAEL